MANVNIFGRFLSMFSDGIKQEQPENTVSDAIGWTVVKGAEGAAYYTSETGNKKWIDLPEGYNLRGKVYLEEYDQWVYMGITQGRGEVGIADEKTKTYTTIVTDDDLDRPLGLQDCIWTQIRVNVHARCTRIKIYFQTNNIYRVIELFDPCKDYSNTLLMKPTAVSILQITTVKGIGTLDNGAYRACLRIMDDDGNDTNFGPTSQPVYIADGDYRVSETTTYGLVIEGFNLPPEYNLGELVIQETFDGGDKYKVINDVGFGGGYFHYQYTGSEGYYSESKLADINNKYQRYFRGEGLEEVEGSLILFNVELTRNFNLQQYVNKFKLGYRRWLVPIKDAKYYKGLKENENYDFSIRFNGIDGTRTIAFPFINHMTEPEGSVAPGGAGNCQSCLVPVWATKDTSERTKLFINDINEVSQNFRDTFTSENTNITGEVNPTGRIATKEQPTSYVCTGTCGPGSIPGGSCNGTICGVDPEFGTLPRTTQPLNENEEPTYNTDVENLISNTQFVRDAGKAIYIAFQENLLELTNATIRCCGGTEIEKDFDYPDITLDTMNVVKDYFLEVVDRINAANEVSKTPFNEVKYINTGWPCTSPGEIRCPGDECYECRNGTWQYKNNHIIYRNRATKFERTPPAQPSESQPSFAPGNSGGTTNPLGGSFEANPFGNGCIPELNRPIPYSEGWFGYWETNQRYPENIGRDDCKPIFREYAGKNVRLYKVPSLGKEMNFVSLQDGVPNVNDIGNDENNKTYAIFTGIRIEDIIIPAELAEWVNPKDPFTIMYSERDEANKTVISTGILHGTFAGDIQNEEFLFPKHAVNSWEYYDVSINPGGNNTLRRGRSTPIPAYIYHSPDYHIYGNKTLAQYTLVQAELNGIGTRHGHYAESDQPDTWTQPKYNNCGTRQGINLNHYIPKEQPVTLCVKGMAEAFADTIIGKDDLMFSRSLINLYRETSQYVEFKVGESYVEECPPCSDNGIVLLNVIANLFEDGTWTVNFNSNVQGGKLKFNYVLSNFGGYQQVLNYDGDTDITFNTEPTSPESIDRMYFYDMVLSFGGCTYNVQLQQDTWETEPGNGPLQQTSSIILIPNEVLSECDPVVNFRGGKLGFSTPPKGPYGSTNGGAGDNNESDNSFIGDTVDHWSMILNNRAHLVTMMRYLPNQYGSIISRPYIQFDSFDHYNPIYSQKNGQIKISVEIMNGDSFIGQFNYKRSAFVSDKVNEEISPTVTLGVDLEVGGLTNWITDLFLDIFKGIFKDTLRVIGYELIGAVPKSGDASDPRNLFGGLRGPMRAITDINSPILPPSGGETPDAFFPHMLKTYINAYLSSDANLNYRGTGTILLGDDGVAEVYRSKLKTTTLDSTMPEGFNWVRAWLNRIYFKMKEPSRWKMLLRLLLNFLWVYYIGIYFLILGIDWFQKAYATSGGGLPTDGVAVWYYVGMALKILIGTFFILLGVAWINLWANTDLMKKVIDKILSIEWAFPDKILRAKGVVGLGSRWAMHTDRCVQLEDNYFYYNPDYSKTNNNEVTFGIPFFYDTEYCPKKFTNRIMSALKQDPSSPIDAWRQFKPNHYADIPRNRGKITRLVPLNGRLIAHTTDTMIQISYNGDIQRQMTNEELLLGRMYMFGRSVDIYGSVMEGWGGNKDPNSSEITPLGYFYFDRDARRFKFLAGGDQELPLTGMDEFFDDNLKFFILDAFPNFPITDQKCNKGVHFDFAIDHGNDIIYLYKQDWKVRPGKNVTYNGSIFNCDGVNCKLGDPKYFINASYLISYSLRRRSYISRHYWRPDVFLWNRFNIYTKMGDTICNHDEKLVYNNFNGIQYPYFIEIPLKTSQLHNTWILKNIKVIGEVIEVYPDGTWKELDIPIFETFMVYNGRQNSGWLNLREKSKVDDNNLLNDINEEIQVKWARKGNGMVIEEFKNELSDSVKSIDILDEKLDIYSLIDSRPRNNNGVFEDDYVVVRFLTHKQPNQKIHLRKILLEIDTEQDG